ncbi:uncharacterized protein LOC123556866 [Mercenaria mercenaria]|uniref:uncharacterized protein LOC123556866 n=1 Tax=Mercenaria mercenaria TaxID=6596 RepID=UPI00234FA7B4|nr:uncharacterized protein LOC123556866 [Mercenaria mercenaria]
MNFQKETDEVERLRKKLEEIQKQNEELEKKLVQKEKHQNDIGSRYLQAKKLKTDLHDSQKTIDSLKQKVQMAENETRSIKAELTKRDRHDASLKNELESYGNLERQFDKIKEELKNTKAELEETKSRLSKSMGDKLTDNNPNIADLSDKNRPTKLAERYQEIYDNEWTDAFETLDEIYQNEEKTTSILIHILMGTRDFCEREAEYQMDQIQKAIIQNTSSPGRRVPTNVQKQLKECRKITAETSGKYLYQKYNKELLNSKSSTARRAGRVPDFVAACFNMCWLMAVQDPPIVFSQNVDHGDTFNTDMYKAYTRTGNKVDFVVWPALNLHTNGPVLCKGVAQGYTEVTRRSRSVPAKSRKKNESYETTPENDTDTKRDMKLKTNTVVIGGRSIRTSDEGLENDKSTTRRADKIHRNTPVARQSRATFKPKNLSYYDNNPPSNPKPSENDVDTFWRWREMFGPEEARRLLGQDYDICLKYLKGLGVI